MSLRAPAPPLTRPLPLAYPPSILRQTGSIRRCDLGMNGRLIGEERVPAARNILHCNHSFLLRNPVVVCGARLLFFCLIDLGLMTYFAAAVILPFDRRISTGTRRPVLLTL